MLENLIDRYGKDFNWFEIDKIGKSFGEAFVKEAYKEISRNHPLYRVKLVAIAKCDSNDDVLFKTDKGQYVIVHLTYTEVNTDRYPRFVVFSTEDEAISYIEQEYRTNYGCFYCMDVLPIKSFGSPEKYLKCLSQIKELVDSKKFELIESSCDIDKVYNENGKWCDDIISHIIECNLCKRKFKCYIDTYHGNGNFEVIES